MVSWLSLLPNIECKHWIRAAKVCLRKKKNQEGGYDPCLASGSDSGLWFHSEVAPLHKPLKTYFY